jgi:hypothetical protein
MAKIHHASDSLDDGYGSQNMFPASHLFCRVAIYCSTFQCYEQDFLFRKTSNFCSILFQCLSMKVKRNLSQFLCQLKLVSVVFHVHVMRDKWWILYRNKPKDFLSIKLNTKMHKVLQKEFIKNSTKYACSIDRFQGYQFNFKSFKHLNLPIRANRFQFFNFVRCNGGT